MKGNANVNARNREEWLERAVEAFRPWFSAAGFALPERIRVSIGFPSRNALSNRNRAIGQCWSPETSRSGHVEIFISPVLEDPSRVCDVLVHELCHAATPGAGHKGRFAKAARALGLAGQLTATNASPELAQRLNAVLPTLGPMPHAALDPLTLAAKKQPTRLLKAQCSGCGYTIRVTQKWIDAGLPTCTTCGCLFETAA